MLRPTTSKQLHATLVGAKFLHLRRRGKYLLFDLKRNSGGELTCLGHLGMTGRMFLQPTSVALPKHTAVVLDLGKLRFVYEDSRYFGRFTLDTSSVEALGPEPLSTEFNTDNFEVGLKRSSQSIKVKLLDQSLVAGIGNIYANEALFRAKVSPLRAARRLKREEIHRLHDEIRNVLQEAIDCGSTIPLDFAGARTKDRLFYFGSAPDTSIFYEERLRVYDRKSQPCWNCKSPLKRIVQSARSTFFCPKCQR